MDVMMDLIAPLRSIAAACLLALLCLAGCDVAGEAEGGPAPADNEAAPLRVAVSIEPHAWLVERIGREHVEVRALVPPNGSPHTFQPTDAEITAVMRSAVYFKTGVAFERSGWFSAIENADRMEVVDLRQGLPLRAMEEHSHGHDGHDGHVHTLACADAHGLDPHVWLSPPLLRKQAETIADALIDLRPAVREAVTANLADLQARLDAVDGEIRAQLDGLESQEFFVFHPAWGYFADEYGLKQVAIEIGGKEPSDAELTNVLHRAREAGIRVIFVQPQITGKSARTVAEIIGGRVEVIDPLARDVAENLRRVADALNAAAKEAGATKSS
jgi:zinc transport system substrate-binding protein